MALSSSSSSYSASSSSSASPALFNPASPNANEQVEEAQPILDEKLSRYARYLREVWAPGTPRLVHFARLASLMEGMVTSEDKVVDIVHSIMLAWILNEQQALNPHLFKQAFLSLDPVLQQHLDLPEVINFTLTGMPGSQTSLFLCSNVDAILDDAFSDSDTPPERDEETAEIEEIEVTRRGARSASSSPSQPQILVPDTPPEHLEDEGAVSAPSSPSPLSSPPPWYTALLQTYLARGYNLLAERYLADPMLCRAQRGVFPTHLTALELDRTLDRFLSRLAPQVQRATLTFQDFMFAFLCMVDGIR
jgi:hypothetical protein